MRLIGSTRWVRRISLAVSVLVSASLLVAVPAGATAQPPKVPEQKYVSGEDRPLKRVKRPPRGQTRPTPPPATSWPKAGAAEARLNIAGGRVRAGSLPVWVGPATKPADKAKAVAPSTVRVELLDGRISQRAKLRGVMFQVLRADGQARAAKASVEFDYSSFRYAYGGDYASRLRLVRFPACVTVTPERKDCRTAISIRTRNDVTKSRLSADVDIAPAHSGGNTGAQGTQAGDTVFAVIASAAAGSGDYKATPLAASAQWQVSAQTGDFGWSYPLRIPPVAAGPSPDLTITYSSGGVDGRTSSTNNQTSWVGEGFDFWQGYIERKYKACLDDTAGGSPQTGDLCWSHDNATMVLNGSATELVLDDDTHTWHLRNDDGSKLEKLTGATNGDDNGEHWKLTTTDGTRYYFGLNRLTGWTKRQGGDQVDVDGAGLRKRLR